MTVLVISPTPLVTPTPEPLKEEFEGPTRIFATPPFGLDNQASCCNSSESKGKNLVLRVLDLLKGIRPGTDLTSFQVPPQFNLPKSQLQLYAEQVYCCKQNLLDQCADEEDPVARFLAVVRWHISLTRPAPFLKAPYNPILGETHHVTAGDLNVLTEQVSHHPPITALHATNATKDIEVSQWSKPVPKLHGGSVEVNIEGRRTLTLAGRGETYEMTCPKLSFRFLPNPGSEWTGDTFVRCVESGLLAKVTFRPRSLVGWGAGACNRVCGTISRITSSQGEEILYTLSGCWDEKILVQEERTGEKEVLYDARAALTTLKALEIKSQTLPATESLVVWSKLTEALWNKDWEAARKGKFSVEESQREIRRERAEAGVKWQPQFFKQNPQGDWQWASKGILVARSLIVG